MNTNDMHPLRAINSDELISAEDEVRLIKQIQHKKSNFADAKEKLMRANQRFVYAIAKQYTSDEFTLDELVAEGNIGLNHAIYKFDEKRGFKFISYAVWWIRQSIQQYILETKKSKQNK